MTPRDLQENLVELQGEVIYRYYDYDNDQIIDINYEQAKDKEIKYMYPETRHMTGFCGTIAEACIVIEVDMDEEDS